MSLVVDGLRSALLGEIRLEVAGGEAVAIRGASGSGKTVFLRAIADLDPSEGTVTLDDVPRSAMTGPEWRRVVRYVAAESAWWGERVGEHFRNPRSIVQDAIELGLPADCMGWEVARLSTGEKQRLGFLRAIEDDPRALLLDEPTAALDTAAEGAVETVIRRLMETGTAIVLVTHSGAQAARLAKRRFLMQSGDLSPDAA